MVVTFVRTLKNLTITPQTIDLQALLAKIVAVGRHFFVSLNFTPLFLSFLLVNNLPQIFQFLLVIFLNYT